MCEIYYFTPQGEIFKYNTNDLASIFTECLLELCYRENIIVILKTTTTIEILSHSFPKMLLENEGLRKRFRNNCADMPSHCKRLVRTVKVLNDV